MPVEKKTTGRGTFISRLVRNRSKKQAGGKTNAQIPEPEPNPNPIDPNPNRIDPNGLEKLQTNGPGTLLQILKVSL